MGGEIVSDTGASWACFLGGGGIGVAIHAFVETFRAGPVLEGVYL